MGPLEPRNPIIASPEKCKQAEAQDKDFKVVFVNMIEILREEMNNFISEIYENTETVERNEKSLRHKSRSRIIKANPN